MCVQVAYGVCTGRSEDEQQEWVLSTHHIIVGELDSVSPTYTESTSSAESLSKPKFKKKIVRETNPACSASLLDEEGNHLIAFL